MMEEEKIVPSKMEMASSLVKTAKDVFIGWLEGGGIIEDADIARQRLKVCASCEYCNSDLSCQLCGCKLEKKKKQAYVMLNAL